MSELEIPESWAEAAIDETAEMLSRGKSPKYSTRQSDVFAINQKCVYWDAIKIENRKEVESLWFRSVADRFKLKYGDILVNSTGTGTLGRVNVWIDNNLYAVPDSHLTLWRPKLPISPFFMSSFLRSFEGQKIIQSATSGSTNQIELSKGKFGAGKVPIPPAAEQHRIVSKIEATHSKIAAIEKAVTEAEALLKKYRESLLAKAFRGELSLNKLDAGYFEQLREVVSRVSQETATSKKHFPLLDADDIESWWPVPKEWSKTTWNHVVQRITYGFTKPVNKTEDGIPVITAKNVLFGEVDFSSAYRISEAEFSCLSEKDKPINGDLLITKDGSIGRVACVNVDYPFCINQSVAVVRLHKSVQIDRTFLMCLVQSPYYQSLIEEHAKDSTTIKHLSITDLGKSPLPLPSYNEQKEIVAIVQHQLAMLNRLSESVYSLQKYLVKARQSVLNMAFLGRLVPQDPAEGTGHELLAQILKAKHSESIAKETKKPKAARVSKK